MALTGPELIARVDELKGKVSEPQIATDCGYTTPGGKASVSGLRAALLDAHGLLPAAPKGRRGRALKFEVTAGTKGQVVLSGGYSTLIGIAPGDAVGVQHVGNSLIVHPAGVVPTFRDEPVPQVGEMATYEG